MKKEIAKIQKRIDQIKNDLQKEIEKLPDNPNITRLSSQSFTINSSNLGKIWDPFYHDFKAQYTKIIHK